MAIAGLPDNTPVDATIIPPATTEAPATTNTEAPVATTTPTTEAPAPTATEPDDADSTTDTTDTTEPADEATDTLPAELPDRDEIVAVAAIGSNVAARAATLLTELEYVGPGFEEGRRAWPTISTCSPSSRPRLPMPPL